MKQNFNNKRTGTKPTVVSLPIVFTGVDKNGRNFDVDSCKQIIVDLQNADVFKKLSVQTQIQRSTVTDDENAKGVLTIARIQSVDTDTWDASVMLFGKNVEYAEKIKDFVIVPCVRTGRDSDEVISILRFEIVRAMDA